MKPFDILLAITVTVTWGVNFPFAKLGLDILPPFWILTLRFFIVGIVLLPFYKDFFIKPKYPLVKIYAYALSSATFHSFMFYAIWMGIDLSAGAVYLQMNVPLTCLFSALFFHDKIEKKQVIGIVISIIGALYVLWNDRINEDLLVSFVALTAAFAMSFFNLSVKALGKIDVLYVLGVTSTISAIHLLIAALIFEPIDLSYLVPLDVNLIYSLSYTVFISTLIGFALWAKLISKYPVHQVTIFGLLVPISGIISSVIMFDEKITLRFLIGTFVILVGIALVNFKVKSKRKNKKIIFDDI